MCGVRCVFILLSLCSRCDNGGGSGKPGTPAGKTPAFEPPVKGIVEAPVEGVLDVVKVPTDLPPGEYVVGWRYDCEATAQVCLLSFFPFFFCL